MKKIYALVILLLISCSKEKKIVENPVVYIKTGVEKPKDCAHLGVVTGATLKDVGVGEAYKRALKDIRKSAKSLGANYLYLKRVSTDSKFIAGVAYSCKN